MTRHRGAQPKRFTGADGNRLVADVFGDRRPRGALLHGGGQTRHAWRKTAEHDRAGRHDRLRDRPARPRRFRMGCRRRLCVFGFRRRRARDCDATCGAPRRAAGGRRRLARRHRGAACRRRGAKARRAAAVRRLWCWSTSRRASICRASRRCRASCARMRRRALPRSPRPPTRSRPICRIGRGRARTRG